MNDMKEEIWLRAPEFPLTAVLERLPVDGIA